MSDQHISQPSPFIVPFPPPFPSILPGHSGPIYYPHENDVLCGRGNQVNSHVGNIQYRALVSEWKPLYNDLETANLEKTHICAEIVARIRTKDPPGRYLRFDEESKVWLEIGDAKARKKVGQALRQKKPIWKTTKASSTKASEKSASAKI